MVYADILCLRISLAKSAVCPVYMEISFSLCFVKLYFFLGSFGQEINDFLKCPVSPLLTPWALDAVG